MKSIFSTLFSLVLVLVSASVASAQDMEFSYLFEFEPVRVTKGPDIAPMPFKLPEEARKKGIEGTVKVSFIFGANGMIRDAQIVNDLPHVGEAVKDALNRTNFKPGEFDGRTVDIKATVSLTVSLVFYEGDKNVNKVKFPTKPTAPYPDKFRAEGRKGKVNVLAVFHADGKVKVRTVDSTMPPEFDEIAKKAAEKLTFEPATNKSTKKPVSMQMWITFEFKP